MVLNEGDRTDDNLYLVASGQLLLKRRVKLERGVSKVVQFAVLQAGHTFNEQAVLATLYTQQQDELKLRQ